jgi:hypothetical protein
MRASPAVLISLIFIGCTENKPTENSPVSKEFIEQVELVSANIEKQKTEEAAFLEKLKTDPQPLYDRAIADVKKGLAETAGDMAANAASITIDKSSLKTFGPEKWTVRGNLKATDKDGNPKDTTWEVTMQIMFGSLQTRKVDLEVDK